MRLFVALGAAAVVACSDGPIGPAGGSDGGVTPGTSLVDVKTGNLSGFGARADYVIAVPRSYAASKQYPLVLVLHGDGGNGAGMRGAHTLDNATGDDAIVVYPSGKSNTWDLSTPFEQNQDQSYIEALIAAVKAEYSIDAARVSGVGWSSGGFQISQLTCRRSGIFRGIVIHAGGAPFELPENEQKDASGYLLCPNASKVAALVTHGTADTTVEPSSGNYASQFWAHANGCNPDTSARVATTPAPCESHPSCPSGNDVTFCLIPGNDHGIWPQAITVEWAFLKKL